MSVLAPTRGELLDRLSILTLKVLYSEGTASAQWREEARQIQGVLGPEGCGDPTFEELCRVNHQIWRGNEELAVIAANAKQGRFSTPHGLDMFRWNKERVRLIEAIDRAAGQFVQHAKVGY